MRRASHARHLLIAQELDSLAAELSGNASMTAVSASEEQAVAFANGRPVAAPAAEVLRQQRFDVILSLPLLKVWSREGSGTQGKWCQSGVRLRKNRLSLFTYMLMHPRAVIGPHNAEEICRSDDVSPNALASTMRTFRTLLHQDDPAGPYLVNTKGLVQTSRHHSYIGNGYTMNANHNYLVICEKF